MILVNSSKYDCCGYDPETGLWVFRRKLNQVGDTVCEIVNVGRAKFVDKSSDCAFIMEPNGEVRPTDNTLKQIPKQTWESCIQRLVDDRQLEVCQPKRV